MCRFLSADYVEPISEAEACRDGRSQSAFLLWRGDLHWVTVHDNNFEGVITLFKVLRLPCLMCESQLHESDSFDDTDFEQTFHCLNVCGWAAKELAKPCSWLTNLSFELQIPSSRKVCVKVLFQRAFDVGKPQPSSASVYSYYEPGTRWYSQ